MVSNLGESLGPCALADNLYVGGDNYFGESSWVITDRVMDGASVVLRLGTGLIDPGYAVQSLLGQGVREVVASRIVRNNYRLLDSDVDSGGRVVARGATSEVRSTVLREPGGSGVGQCTVLGGAGYACLLLDEHKEVALKWLGKEPEFSALLALPVLAIDPVALSRAVVAVEGASRGAVTLGGPGTPLVQVLKYLARADAVREKGGLARLVSSLGCAEVRVPVSLRVRLTTSERSSSHGLLVGAGFKDSVTSDLVGKAGADESVVVRSPGESGYCYLAIVKEEQRPLVAAVLGKDPSLEELAALDVGRFDLAAMESHGFVSSCPGFLHVEKGVDPSVRDVLTAVCRGPGAESVSVEVWSLEPGGVSRVAVATDRVGATQSYGSWLASLGGSPAHEFPEQELRVVGSMAAVLGPADKERQRVHQAVGDAVLTLVLAADSLARRESVETHSHRRSTVSSNKGLGQLFVDRYPVSFFSVPASIDPGKGKVGASAVEASLGLIFTCMGYDAVVHACEELGLVEPRVDGGPLPPEVRGELNLVTWSPGVFAGWPDLVTRVVRCSFSHVHVMHAKFALAYRPGSVVVALTVSGQIYLEKVMPPTVTVVLVSGLEPRSYDGVLVVGTEVEDAIVDWSRVVASYRVAFGYVLAGIEPVGLYEALVARRTGGT